MGSPRKRFHLDWSSRTSRLGMDQVPKPETVSACGGSFLDAGFDLTLASRRYIGKLESGVQFDSNTSGKPFSFVLGKGEVIRGWDQALAGLAVGGERRLTVRVLPSFSTLLTKRRV